MTFLKIRTRTLFRITLFIVLLSITINQELQSDETEKEREVASHIKVSHYECEGAGFKNAKIYSIGEIESCTLAPDEIELAYVKVVLYQKTYLRKVEATRCEVKHSKLVYHCGQ